MTALHMKDGKVVIPACTHCGCELLDYSDVGYDGPKERSNNACNPFMAWETLCHKCDKEELR